MLGVSCFTIKLVRFFFLYLLWLNFKQVLFQRVPFAIYLLTLLGERPTSLIMFNSLTKPLDLLHTRVTAPLLLNFNLILVSLLTKGLFIPVEFFFLKKSSLKRRLTYFFIIKKLIKNEQKKKLIFFCVFSVFIQF